MKLFQALSGLLVAALTMACTFQSVTHQPGLGRVILSNASRALSASTDIKAITYKTTDLTGLDDVKVKSGKINIYSLTADLFLTPGSRYRIEVDVDLNANAPGTNVGVLKYGDQVEFDVDPYYDTYVDLTARPNKAIVLNPASVVGGASSTIQRINPYDTAPSFTQPELFGGTLTPSPRDRLFYGPEAKLYYFNENANKIYQWKDVGTKMGPSDVEIEGTAGTKGLDLTYDFKIYAACADPLENDVLWVVIHDTTSPAPGWYYARVDVSNAAPEVTRSSDLTADFEGSEVGPTVVPTAIAVDSVYYDVYLTFYRSTSTSFHSGILEYYNDTLFGPTPSSDLVSTDSIYTDAIWDQGKLWVLTSPVTLTNLNPALPAATVNTGWARIIVFNDLLETQTVFPPSLDQTYSGSLSPLSGSTKLVLPNRFAGPVQGTSLFVSQWSAQGDGSHVLSRVDFSGTVTSY